MQSVIRVKRVKNTIKSILPLNKPTNIKNSIQPFRKIKHSKKNTNHQMNALIHHQAVNIPKPVKHVAIIKHK